MPSRYILILLLFLIYTSQLSARDLSEMVSMFDNIPEDGKLSFCGLATKYGYECIKYNVTTKDGYILGMFNIPGNKSRPVYMQHGFVDSSDTFMIRGNTSMVAFLADNGYDVWLGNMRGNMHSRAHISLNPDTDMEFWDFSFHEIACIDLTTMIDFVLEKTGQKKLQTIAHSEGTTLFFVMGAERPEYNDKIKLFVALAPIAYLHNSERPMFPLASLSIGPFVSPSLTVLSHGEMLRNSSQVISLVRIACTIKMVGYAVCAEGFAFTLFGRDREQVGPDFFPIAMGHYPGGSSRKNGAHLLQVAARRKFAQYDYGFIENFRKYGKLEPPNYDLGKVTMPVVITVGVNDRINDLRDVKLLRNQLGNVVDYYVVKWKKWNHSDFVWGKEMKKYLFDYVHEMLQKYL